MTEAGRFRSRLKTIGLSDSAINAAWPEWWSDDADPSSSARLELRFSIARKLGLDARSVVDEEGAPRFVWRDEARFKHLAGETEIERSAISSFGRSIGSFLLAGTDSGQFSILGSSAATLREAVLRSQQYVRLVDLLALSWSAGIPVAHLRVYPAGKKRMAAMSIGLADRYCILLAKDSMYPPHIAFYLGHEIAHVALGHVRKDAGIVDMESNELSTAAADSEEADADRYALELLTGTPTPAVLPASSESYNAPGLADAVLRVANQTRIEPGTLALCFGFSTKNWAVANSAMKFIYTTAKPVWSEINRLAVEQIQLDQVPSDAHSYLRAVLGL